MAADQHTRFYKNGVAQLIAAEGPTPRAGAGGRLASLVATEYD